MFTYWFVFKNGFSVYILFYPKQDNKAAKTQGVTRQRMWEKTQLRSKNNKTGVKIEVDWEARKDFHKW